MIYIPYGNRNKILLKMGFICVQRRTEYLHLSWAISIKTGLSRGISKY